MSGIHQGASTTMLQSGAGTGLINLLDHTISDSVVGATSFAQYGLGTNGQASYVTLNGASGNFANEWTNPVTGGQGGTYEVRATLNSGSLEAGSSATGSWLALTSNRGWQVQRAGSPGNQSANLTIEIRLNAGAVQDSCTIVLSATFL